MICILELRSFAPVGIHWYGKLYLYDKEDYQCGDSVSLTYKLGILQARAMNKCNGIDTNYSLSGWQAGMECNAFFTKELVIDVAKRTWRKAFPTATRLCLGERHLAGYKILEKIEDR